MRFSAIIPRAHEMPRKKASSFCRLCQSANFTKLLSNSAGDKVIRMNLGDTQGCFNIEQGASNVDLIFAAEGFCARIGILGVAMDSRFFLVLMLGGAMMGQVHAGIIFGKKPAKNPNERVPELIVALQNNGDEDKRVDAAAELRQFDPAQFPQIVPALIQALNNDAKPSVRAEAAASLSKIRPVSNQVGLALENALAKDASMRVRIQARSSLLQYNLAGYRTPTKPVAGNQSGEPPLLDIAPNTAPISAKPAVRPVAPAPVSSTSSLIPVPSFLKPVPSKPVEKSSIPALPTPKKDNVEGPQLFPN